jgi:hypothetical protein
MVLLWWADILEPYDENFSFYYDKIGKELQRIA